MGSVVNPLNPTVCVKDSLSRRIGFRLEWDAWSSRDIPVCARVDQLLRFEQEYRYLSPKDQWNVVNNTGCLTPCSYTEYKLAAEPLKKAHKNPRLMLMLTSSFVKSRKEELIYPLVSFVAEFGGSLGLFLGFSFFMIWDALEVLIHILLKQGGKLKL